MTCQGCLHYEACFVNDVLKKDEKGELANNVRVDCDGFRYANIIGAIDLLKLIPTPVSEGER